MDDYISVEDLVELPLLMQNAIAYHPILVYPLDSNNAPPSAPLVVPAVVPLPPQNVEQPVPAQLDQVPAQINRVPAEIARVPAQVNRMPAQINRVPAQIAREPAQVNRVQARINREPAHSDQVVSAGSVPSANISEVSLYDEFGLVITWEIDVLVEVIGNGRAFLVPVYEAEAFRLGLHGRQAALADGQQQSAPIEPNPEPADLPADLIDNTDPQQFDADTINLNDLQAFADTIVDDHATLNLELCLGTETAVTRQNTMEEDEEMSDEEEQASEIQNLIENLQEPGGSNTDLPLLVLVPPNVRVSEEQRIGVSTAATSTSSRQQQLQPVISLRQPVARGQVRRSVRDYFSSRPKLGAYSNEQSIYAETESQDRQSASTAVATSKSNRCVPQSETSTPAKRRRKRSTAQIEDESQSGPSGVSRQHKRPNVTTVEEQSTADDAIDRAAILRHLRQLQEEHKQETTLYAEWWLEYDDLNKQHKELTGSVQKQVGEAKCRANNYVKKHDTMIKLIEANTTILKLKLKIDDLQKQILLLQQRQVSAVVNNDLTKINWQNSEYVSFKRRRLLDRRLELAEERVNLTSEIEKDDDHSRRIPTSKNERSIEAEGRQRGLTKATERTAAARRRLEAIAKEHSENEREIQMQELRDRNMFLEELAQRQADEILAREWLAGSSPSDNNPTDRGPDDEGRVDKNKDTGGEEEEEEKAKDLPRATKSKHDHDSKDW